MGEGTQERERARLMRPYRESLPFVYHASRLLHSMMSVPPGTKLSEGLGLPWHMPTPAELAEEEIHICVDEDTMNVDQKSKNMSLCESPAFVSAHENGSSSTLSGSSMTAMNAVSASTLAGLGNKSSNSLLGGDSINSRKSFTASTIAGPSNGSSSTLGGDSINSMNAFTASALSEAGSGNGNILRQGSTPIANPFLTPGGSLSAKSNQSNMAEESLPSSKQPPGRLLHSKQLAQQKGIGTGVATSASTAAQSKGLNRALRLAAPPVPAESENATLTNAREQLKRKYKDFQSPKQKTPAHSEIAIPSPYNTTVAPQQLLPSGFQRTLAGPLIPIPTPGNRMPDISVVLANGFHDTPPTPTIIPKYPSQDPQTTLSLVHKHLSPQPIFLLSGSEHWSNTHTRHRSSLSSSSDENTLPHPSNWLSTLPTTLASHINNPRVTLEATTLTNCKFTRANDAKHWNQVCSPALGVYPRLIRIVLPTLQPGDVFLKPAHRDWLLLELVYPPPPRRGRPPKVPKKIEPKYLVLAFPTPAVSKGEVERQVVKGKGYCGEKFEFGGKGRLPLMFGRGKEGAELQRWMHAFERGGACLEVEYAEEQVRCWV